MNLRTNSKIFHHLTTISPSISAREKMSAYVGTSCKDEPTADPEAGDQTLTNNSELRNSRKKTPMMNGLNYGKWKNS
jgi:hypothetical protein